MGANVTVVALGVGAFLFSQNPTIRARGFLLALGTIVSGWTGVVFFRFHDRLGDRAPDPARGSK